MNPLEIIERYYPKGSPAYELLVLHSLCVRDKALAIVDAHPELEADRQFVSEAAMLHDIGVCATSAPSIYCMGSLPYICHGVEGSRMLQAEGLPHHALVCERHTGAGLTAIDIEQQGLPIPVRDMLPISIEEQIICYADKFFSKSSTPTTPKAVEKIRGSLARYGADSVVRFDQWHALFSF